MGEAGERAQRESEWQSTCVFLIGRAGEAGVRETQTHADGRESRSGRVCSVKDRPG